MLPGLPLPQACQALLPSIPQGCSLLAPALAAHALKPVQGSAPLHLHCGRAWSRVPAGGWREAATPPLPQYCPVACPLPGQVPACCSHGQGLPRTLYVLHAQQYAACLTRPPPKCTCCLSLPQSCRPGPLSPACAAQLNINICLLPAVNFWGGGAPGASQRPLDLQHFVTTVDSRRISGNAPSAPGDAQRHHGR